MNKIQVIEKIQALLKRKRVQNLSIREISKEVGISTGSFYNLFQDKDELLFEIRKHEICQMSDYIDQILDKEKDYLFIPAIRLSIMFDRLVEQELLFETMSTAKESMSMKEAKMANIIYFIKMAFKDYTSSYSEEDYKHREIMISGMIESTFQAYIEGFDIDLDYMQELIIQTVYRTFDVPEDKIDYILNNYRNYLRKDVT
ncbi:TetR/AcrR family transcriptional regulator [Acidaminobacter sp. JC074]|uniref:TetR/AcrR family transcriptional regulator n=1 Tax=Acidaminobacter sp. JC074 TaxID=2530199 RepID=UPI001F0D0B89|nr:TetR/AcrR family transcriptional regulator [Acidaminobacter sp. JC074]MCH4889827.1 TetR/AcrR family transcriptional regulator [Acidaminobacter sp. JC074]